MVLLHITHRRWVGMIRYCAVLAWKISLWVVHFIARLATEYLLLYSSSTTYTVVSVFRFILLPRWLLVAVVMVMVATQRPDHLPDDHLPSVMAPDEFVRDYDG
jgi:hypothetical protein